MYHAAAYYDEINHNKNHSFLLLSEYEALMQELQNLLPDLADRWQKLQPQILVLMIADTSTVAVRLLQLKMWFPEANVSTMVSQRYSLGMHVLCNVFALKIFHMTKCMATHHQHFFQIWHHQLCKCCRPTLVLDEEFNGIPAAMKVMQHWFAADAIDHMVQEEPLFLVEDVESAISSLNRYTTHLNMAINYRSTRGLKA